MKRPQRCASVLMLVDPFRAHGFWNAFLSLYKYASVLDPVTDHVFALKTQGQGCRAVGPLRHPAESGRRGERTHRDGAELEPPSRLAPLGSSTGSCAPLVPLVVPCQQAASVMLGCATARSRRRLSVRTSKAETRAGTGSVVAVQAQRLRHRVLHSALVVVAVEKSSRGGAERALVLSLKRPWEAFP